MTTLTTTPAGPATPPAPRHDSLRSAWIPLLALALAFFVEMIDNTVLNIALPTIGRDLGGGTTALQWITGAYALTFGGLLLTAGSLADRFGRRRILLIGLAAFGLFSAPVMLVTSPGQLIAMRAALGVAAACMAPVTISLVYRLFDDEKLRMRAISLMVVVGMLGFALGPIAAGSVLTQVSWHWLLLVNVPIAAIAWVGVRLGVPADVPADLHPAPLDLPGAALTSAVMGLAAYSLTSGVERGWTAPITLLCAAGAVVALGLFVRRERRVEHPMLDLQLFTTRTVRGAAIAQLGASLAMVGMMFPLVLHFQEAYAWSPMVAGLANLPIVVTMLAGTPVAEQAAARLGHRVACLIGAALLTGSLVGLAWAVPHGYLAIAVAMVGLTLGLRIIMTICAVALVDAMPENRTTMGAALNDTAGEVGTSVGVAVVGTALAALAAGLPGGAWGPAAVASFFHAEQVTFLVLAVLVGVVATYGANTLTDSRSVEEH